MSKQIANKSIQYNNNNKKDTVATASTDSDNENDNDNSKYPTQLEMVDILIKKIKTIKNVDIKTKEVENNLGSFYAINVHIKLSDIGNGVFHSATLKTVSYSGRIVKIKCVLSDNENLRSDMKINRDSLFQCFRDIAPDTITTISLEDFKDQTENEHTRLIATTVRGSSLIFVYKKLMEFVNTINEKYGNLISSTASIPISDDPIEDLDAEEKRLQKLLDNIKLLREAQKSCLEATKQLNIENQNKLTQANNSYQAIQLPQKPTPYVDTTTFAYKVSQSLQKK